jgi:hypothetical protein
MVEHEVLGLKLNLPSIYTAGHTMTEFDAKFGNRALHSVVLNGYGGDVRRQLVAIDKSRLAAYKAGKYDGPTATNEKGKVTGPQPATAADIPNWDHQAKVLEKFANYKVGVSNRMGGGSKSSPLESIIEGIALAAVKAQIKLKGLSVQKFQRMPNDKYGNELNRAVADYISTRRETLEALAKQQMEQTAAEAGDGFDLTLPGDEGTDEAQKAA